MNINKIDINEIKKITRTAISQKEKEAIEAKQKLEEEEREKDRKDFEYAKNLTNYISAIENAAKNGQNNVSVDIGDCSHNLTRYRIQNIQLELKEFSPEIEYCDDYYFDRNYNGEVIDSTIYKKAIVKFKW
jgi:hypothetical protein